MRSDERAGDPSLLDDGLDLEERVVREHGANTIVRSYSLPDSAEPGIEAMVEAIQPGVADALATLTGEFGDTIDDIVADMQPCDHCRTQKYETYVLLTALRRAFVRAQRTE